jgi:hypothetical protein
MLHMVLLLARARTLDDIHEKHRVQEMDIMKEHRATSARARLCFVIA